MTMIDIGDLKSARELFCRAQNALIHYKGNYSPSEINRLQQMIDQIDVLRPLGPNGKHGTRHTDHCGCDGEIVWRPLRLAPQISMDSTTRIKGVDGKIYTAKVLYLNLHKGHDWPSVIPVRDVFHDTFPELIGPTDYPIMQPKVD